MSGLFSYAPGEYRYEVLTESHIQLRTDSADPSDSTAAVVRTGAEVTMRLLPVGLDSLQALVRVDSLWAERDSLIPAPDSLEGPSATIAAESLVVDLQGDRTDPPGGSGDCGETAMRSLAQDLIVPLPGELLVGQSWADTSTVSICRGGIPVTSGVVRSYSVTGSRRDTDGNPIMMITRSTTFSLAGTTTTEHGQIIALTGTGHSTAELELDLRGGVVRSASRDGTSEVSVTYGRSTTPFLQRLTTRIRLLEARPVSR